MNDISKYEVSIFKQQLTIVSQNFWLILFVIPMFQMYKLGKKNVCNIPL